MKTYNFSSAPWPLWFKICAALVCTTVAVSLIAVQLDSNYRQRQLSDELKQQSYLVLKLISAGAQESLIMEDIPMLNSLVSETAELDPNLTSLIISNESGQPMAKWNRDDYSITSSTAYFEQAIDFESELFGTVKAQWDPVGLAEKVDSRLARGRKTLLFALLCLTFLSLILLHVLVASPLSKLTNRLRNISGGDSTDKLKIQSSKEMSMLADAVNELDVTVHESRVLATELEYQATHDSLTGLYNRAAFETALNISLENRLPTSSDDVLIYFDLDQFKVVNDTCGHAAGDDLLVQLTKTLSLLLKPENTFARLGGDEFAILLNSTSLQEGKDIAEKIRAATQDQRFLYQDRVFIIGASVGLVCISDVDERVKRIMTAADEACYAAKDAGRNRVHVYQEDDNELNQRRGEMDWIPRIHAAIESSNMVLYGQAIESTKSHENDLLHVEILVRMLDDDGATIPPGAFLPAAERYGVMPKVDRWVISNTLRWMEQQKADGNSVPLCSINISGISVSDQKFRDYLLHELSQTSVPAGNICFEITETAAVSQLSSVIEFMTTVKQVGCQFALDDFGAGMSSFNYLKNMPVDYVKIDGAFVSPLLTDETCVVMVRAIGDIARVMGIKSIAEFVENDDIRNKLSELGVDYVQGYGVGMPQALSEFKKSIVSRAA